MPDDDQIQTTIKDPEFLKLGPDDQVAVLKHLQENAAPSTDSLGTKIGRGFSGGVKQGLGISEDTNLGSVPGILKGGAQYLGNTIQGISTLGNAAAGDVEDMVSDPIKYFWTDRNKPSQLGQAVGAIPKGLTDSGGEAWKGLKSADPEMFAHGFASMATQAAQLALAAKGAFKTPTPRGRLAGTANALKAGDVDAANITKAMPNIVEESKSAGIKTVGDFTDTVQKALDTRQAKFSAALAPHLNTLVDTSSIAQNIRGLATVTHDTEQLAAIEKAAKMYDTPKTMKWLEQKRSDLNALTAPIWEKTPSDIATAVKNDLDLNIARAARNKIAGLEYDVLDRASKAVGQRFNQVLDQQPFGGNVYRGMSVDELEQTAQNGKLLPSKSRIQVRPGEVSSDATSNPREAFRFSRSPSLGGGKGTFRPENGAIAEFDKNRNFVRGYEVDPNGRIVRSIPETTPMDFGKLKEEQSTLMAIKDFLGDKAKGTGKVGELYGKQLQHEGQGIGERLKTGASVSPGSVHGYISGLSNMFSKGPLTKANSQIGRAFGGTYTTPARLAFMSLPVANLASPRRTTPFDINPPPAPPSDADQQ